MPLLDVSSLSVTYPGAVKPVVKDFDLKVREGEFVGLMGSSGSGKTTITRSIFGNLPAGTSVEGTILFSGTPMGAHRWWRDISLVPQSSMSSLNPSFRIGTTIEETCKANNVDFSHRRICELLDVVELAPNVAAQFPHELSGGMRQRVCIALALACNPRMVVLDEATTGLDVLVEAHIVALLDRLRKHLGLSAILVSHDPRIMSALADSVVSLEESQ